VYIVTSLKNCGPIHQLYHLINHLSKEMFEIIVITAFQEGPNSKYHDFLDLGIEIKSLQLHRRNFIKTRKKLIATVKSLQPDLIHTSSIRTDYWSARYFKNYCRMTTVHSNLEEDYRWTYGFFLGKLLTHIHRRILLKIPYRIACSNSVALKLKEKLKIDAHVIRNGIDIHHFAVSSSQEKKKLREILNLAVDKKLFVFSGSLSKLKNPLLLIQAFQRAQISDKACLVFLGKGPLLEDMRQLAVEGIWVMGHVQNVSDYLKAADVLVSASHTEGMPLSVLEAMASGLPVLLSHIPPHEEIMGDADVGNLFDLEDIGELAGYFRQYVYCDVSQKGIYARERIEKEFCADRMGHEYEEFYRKILDCPKS